MERDALLAHGTAFVLQDRLMNSSDYSTTWVCKQCGSIISLGYDDVSLGQVVTSSESQISGPQGEHCRFCRRDDGQQTHSDVIMDVSNVQKGFKRDNSGMTVIAVPYVFR